MVVFSLEIVTSSWVSYIQDRNHVIYGITVLPYFSLKFGCGIKPNQYTFSIMTSKKYIKICYKYLKATVNMHIKIQDKNLLKL